jgi:chitinase
MGVRETVAIRLGWFFACVLGVVALPAGAESRVVAYVQGGSIPAVIHPEKLTHINFSFAHISDGRAVLDMPGSAEDLATLRALKKVNPRLKVLVSVGGWTADGFSDAALTDASRHAFAASVIEMLRDNDLDGVDLDWEYPGQGVAGIKYREADKGHFTLLLKTVRHELDIAGGTTKHTGAGHYLLTIAAADREYFDHVEVSRLHVYVDWINEMAYDFFNSLTPTTGHHAGLYRSKFGAPTDRTADAAVKQYLAAGVPADKIVLGVPFYGRAFAGVTAKNHGIDQPYERFQDFYSYDDLAQKFIGKDGYVRYWDAEAQVPYLWNEASRSFISYEDPQSLGIKVCYVRDQHLGGVMFWELKLDRNDELLDVIARGCSPH